MISGHTKLVLVLLQNRAQVDVRGYWGDTPLYLGDLPIYYTKYTYENH